MRSKSLSFCLRQELDAEQVFEFLFEARAGCGASLWERTSSRSSVGGPI